MLIYNVNELKTKLERIELLFRNTDSKSKEEKDAKIIKLE